MFSFFESPQIKKEDAHEGGPSAFRAVWLQEKMRGENPVGEGLPIIAESSVAKTLADNYPEAWSMDSGFEDLGGNRSEKLASRYPEHTWAIIARKGSTPMVTVENIQTGDFLPNDQTVYMDESWRDGANPFAEKIKHLKQKMSAQEGSTEERESVS